ncbi:MAG: tyrosine-type recombinase/integrase [Bellilinea sp.]
MTDQALVTITAPVIDWRSEFSGWLEERGKSARTITAYRQDIGRFAEWFAAVNRQPLTPDLVTGYDLRAYREHSIQTERVSAATWNRRRASLAQLCNWARQAGYLVYDPFQGVLPMGEVELAPRWLNRSDQGRVMRQVERLANTATTAAWQKQAARDQAMFALMRQCGLRVGELVALNLEDITLGERSGSVVIRRGKGDKRRVVPLNSEARLVLGRWLDLRGPGGSGEPVFNGKGTTRLTTRTVERRVADIGRMAGVDITPHQLRHTFLKRMVENGVPVTDAQTLAGHSRIETTRRYLTPGWDDLTAAVEKSL